MLLCPGYIPGGHDQYALGRLRVVASGRSPRLEILEVFQYLLEPSSRPRVIILPWLSDPGVGALKFPDNGEDLYDIYNYGKGVPLGHTLLAIQEVV